MRSLLTLLLAVATLWAASPRAEAGGSPETTLVVANGDSPSSMRVANEYVRLRKIPATHVLVVDGLPSLGVIPVETFRDKIWAPIRAWLTAQKLEGRIDTIAYSTDFPYGVDFTGDKANVQNPPITPTASLTSMTYLARRVEKKDATGYLDLTINGYYRRYVDQENLTRRDRTDAEADAYRAAGEALIEKRWADAATAFETLLRTYAEDFAIYYDYACCLALLGKADAAILALTKAVDLGYADLSHTKKDPDLDSLRQRPEFKVLLERMEASEKETLSRGAGAQPAHGFSSRWAWTGAVDPVKDPGDSATDRYWLSTLLGYTGQWGNSVPEVLDCLASAAKSDGTNPAGTVYVCKNGDVRSTTREPRFEALVSSLAAMGRKGAILEKGQELQTGVLPVCREDVIGAVVGISDFDWTGCKSRFLPGAIAEHLTSFGAVFNAPGQTKCSAFIRAGAAGTSGAVYEPYAIPMKFPTPHVHVFYAEGCSLAEAFYQSVWGPYQLLVIGDPLARPFAHLAAVAAPKRTNATPLSGRVDLATTVAPSLDRPIDRVELWVDGRWVAEAAPGATIAWDTTQEEDGAHEVRLVAVEAHRVGTRSTSDPVVVVVSNTKAAIPTLVAPKGPVGFEGAVSLSGRAPGAKEVQVLAGTRLLEMVPVSGDAWKVAVTATRLGMGETTVSARAIFAAGEATRSLFATVRVAAPQVHKVAKTVGRAAPKTAPGLRVDWSEGKGKFGDAVLSDLGGFGATGVAKQLAGKVTGTPKSILIEGEFEVKTAGLYQFLISGSGVVGLRVDRELASVQMTASSTRPEYGLVSLEAGWHAIALTILPQGSWDFSVLLGGDQVTAPMAGAMLRHAEK